MVTRRDNGGAPGRRHRGLLRVAATALLVATACGRAHPPRSITAATGDDHSCLRARGCPPARPLPRCPDDIQVRSLEDVLAHRGDLVDQPVAVRGPVAPGLVICTERACYGGCCNRCEGSLQLGRPNASSADATGASTLQLLGGSHSCRGDESLVCCDVDTARGDVVARGTLRRHGSTWSVDGPSLCTLS